VTKTDGFQGAAMVGIPFTSGKGQGWGLIKHLKTPSQLDPCSLRSVMNHPPLEFMKLGMPFQFLDGMMSFQLLDEECGCGLTTLTAVEYP